MNTLVCMKIHSHSIAHNISRTFCIAYSIVKNNGEKNVFIMAEHWLFSEISISNECNSSMKSTNEKTCSMYLEIGSSVCHAVQWKHSQVWFLPSNINWMMMKRQRQQHRKMVYLWVLRGINQHTKFTSIRTERDAHTLANTPKRLKYKHWNGSLQFETY